MEKSPFSVGAGEVIHRRFQESHEKRKNPLAFLQGTDILVPVACNERNEALESN